MNDFSNRLNELIPAPPNVDEWAERAEKTAKSRRTKRWAGITGAAVAVIALAIALQTILSNTPTPNQPANSLGTNGCPPGTAYQDTQTPKAITLKEGAVSLRWCTIPVETEPHLSVFTPPELLVSNVDAWVAEFNNLKVLKAHAMCTSDMSTPTSFVLTYPDGSTQTLFGMRAGCGVLGGRQGFAKMESLAKQLFLEQRTTTPSPAGTFPRCRPESSAIAGQLDKVTSIDLCDAQYPNVHYKPVDGAAVPGMLADIKANLKPASSDVHGDGPVLMLYQGNGERLILRFSPQAGLWVKDSYSDQGVVYETWTPNAASQKALAAAQAKTATTQTPSSAQPTKPTSADNPCVAKVTDVVTSLPGGASQVWLCSEHRFAPAEPLTESVAEFLQVASQEIWLCEPRPTAERFIVAYPDGQYLQFILPAGDCAPFAHMTRAFISLLEKQRGPDFQGEPAVIEKLCSYDASIARPNVMPMRPKDASVIRVCDLGDKPGTEETMNGLVMKPEEVQAIKQDLIANSVESAAKPAAGMKLKIVLQRANAESIWVFIDGSKLIYQDGYGKTWVWTPTAASTKILDSYK